MVRLFLLSILNPACVSNGWRDSVQKTLSSVTSCLKATRGRLALVARVAWQATFVPDIK